MKPDIWGPAGWFLLHTLTLDYPINPTDIDKINMYNFFMSFQKVIPCDKCKINFADHLKKYPLSNTVLSSRNNLVKWLIDIHNEVNVMNGKKKLSYEEAIRDILYKYKKPKYNYIYFIAAFFVLIILLIIIYYSNWSN